jgi:uroporphyrinogen decarboxylase
MEVTMKAQMTHEERVRAALNNQEVDRVPISMWRHHYARESSGESMAAAMLDFQRRFDWDFMKVNPRASYHVEDWGVKTIYSGDVSPKATETPVKLPEDWLKIGRLDIKSSVLKEHLAALETIAAGLKGEVPFLMTVFTPLSIAADLAPSEEVFLQHLREHTAKVNAALEAITETFAAFAAACLERGAAGIFYATTSWATTNRLSAAEYKKYARPYDLKLLRALPPDWFNILHVCKENNLLAAVADYPVPAFNWDARGEGNPSLAEGKTLVGGKAVIGGIPHGRALVEAKPGRLEAEIAGMRVALGRRGWMLGPGCTFPPETPEPNLRAVRRALEQN